MRPRSAESFSLAGEGHRNRGRFPVELPIYQYTDTLHGTKR